MYVFDNFKSNEYIWNADSQDRPKTCVVTSISNPKTNLVMTNCPLSVRKLTLDKKNLSTTLLKGWQTCLYFKKNTDAWIRVQFREEWSQTGKQDITQHPDVVRTKHLDARSSKNPERATLINSWREVSHRSVLKCITWANLGKCVCLPILGQPFPQLKPMGTGKYTLRVWMLQRAF